MVDFHAAAVRFGKPGKLYIGALDATEPTDATSAWSATDWLPIGYTSEGSTFNYEINIEDVEVAEELDVLARTTTGRNGTVEFAMAEMTKRNLTVAFNGGVVEGDGLAWTVEPPDLGAESRIMIGWDANPTVASNDLRFIFRQCFQGGSVSMSNRKGAEKAVIPVTFQLEKPATGLKPFKILGAAGLNPDDTP